MPVGREIERQFRMNLPASDIIAAAERDGSLLLSYDISQSYLKDAGEWTIRVRKTTYPGLATPSYEQTLKRTVAGIERIEEDVNLDVNGYRRLLRHCGPTLRKRRSAIMAFDRKWEVDVFLNPTLSGLELVEVELPTVDAELILPAWVGEETSHDPSFRNAVLAQRLPVDDRDMY